MTVLGADSTFVLDPFRPIDNERIVSAAFAVRILLPILERSVCGLRPAQRVIPIGGSGRADFSNLIQVIVNILFLRCGPGQYALIHGSVQSTFFACAVIANGYED